MALQGGPKRSVPALLVLTPLTSLLILSACGEFDRGESEKVPDERVTFAEVYSILRARCVNCHAPGLPGSATVFVLETDAPGDYSMIRALVNPERPAESFLLKKASGQVSHGGGPILSESSAEYAAIKEWISEGALND